MGGRVTGIADVLASFQRVHDQVHRAAADALHDQGERLADRSKELAPVDKHNLEAAHHVETERHPDRVLTTISVGGVVNGVDVDEYVEFIHDGDYKLGPGSLAKATGTGQPVGPKFLDRALDERKDKIVAAVDDAVQKAVG